MRAPPAKKPSYSDRTRMGRFISTPFERERMVRPRRLLERIAPTSATQRRCRPHNAGTCGARCRLTDDVHRMNDTSSRPDSQTRLQASRDDRMQPYLASNRIGIALNLASSGERERPYSRDAIDRDLDGCKQPRRDATRLGSHLIITQGAVLSLRPVEPRAIYCPARAPKSAQPSSPCTPCWC